MTSSARSGSSTISPRTFTAATRQPPRACQGSQQRCATSSQSLTLRIGVPDPFAGRVPPVVSRKERKANARAKVHRASPFERGEDIAVSKDEIPTMEQVIALRDPVLRRETSRPPTSSTKGRGAGGGAKPLEKETAAQLAEPVTDAAATGCREAETLAFHTSTIGSAQRCCGLPTYHVTRNPVG
jgi:hypothetical protein